MNPLVAGKKITKKYVNSNFAEPLNELIERLYGEATNPETHLNPSGMGTIHIGEDDTFPFRYNMGDHVLAIVQRRYGLTYEASGDDTVISGSEDGNTVTVNCIKPFKGRILTLGVQSVVVVKFSETDGFPLRIPPDQTGQHQWVMIAVCEERVGDDYVRRHDALTIDADGGVTIHAVRPFSGRVLIVKGA